jgi:hypothetical protein
VAELQLALVHIGEGAITMMEMFMISMLISKLQRLKLLSRLRCL